MKNILLVVLKWLKLIISQMIIMIGIINRK